MRENNKEEKVKQDMDDIKTISIKLEHSVAKLLSKNKHSHKEIDHLKQIYKDQFDSIKRTRVRNKEHNESLIVQLNSKSVENMDLKAQIQDMVFVITSLKNNLRQIKGKEIVENAAQIPIATTIAPGMFKLDLDPLAPRLLKNREAHIDYLKHTQGQADNCSTSTCRSQPTCNKKSDMISQTPSSNMKNKVEAQPRRVNKKNRVKEPTCDANVKHTMLNANSELICVKYVPSSSSLVNDRFRNDQIAKIMGYADYQLGNVIISTVYYVDGLGHNLFYVGKFCDTDLEVAFQKNTCFIWNIEGADLLSGSRDTNLYTISLDDMLKTSSICLLSKASNTNSWLWHRRLSHLNFGKSKKTSHQTKAEDTNQEKFYLLHMDLCGPMRVESINGKNEDLGKLNAKVDIGIFVGYAPAKKAFRIYNMRTWKIMETIHVTFDELTTMASEQFSSGPGLQFMTPATSIVARRAVDLADSHVSTSIDQDVQSTSIPSTQKLEQSLIISQGVEESPKTPHFHDDPLHETLYEDSASQGSSSNVRPSYTLFELLGKWTKNHLIVNVIGDPSHSVSTRKQLQTHAMWCYFDAFQTSVEPKNFKDAITEPSWVDAMQKEIYEFQRLEV
nr:integrase, catalytic region, zinc finger, CCHC-type, peptidase aspartic, catalytic [Tanacetum cinerariifolium]